MSKIAIVGMACRYPDATSPKELWENVVAGRRAFRRLPDVRMRLEDYWDADPTAPDKFYARNAAVIEGYEFDRIAYKIAGSTYRSTDLTHWLALDMAALALADAGFPMAEGLPRERTGVVVGNTLTGEFSRANTLRLRWPFVRRMVAGALKEQGWDDDQLGNFLGSFEATFKSPFPAIDEDTLAGGLSNTIAGRICNHFDLNGGGYTVDGACSSSLLSVATASKALIDGDVDVAIAGGVDLSIDPFEIIGFAKTGALATGEMRIYDRGSNGFWPGEGCGMVVLMRESEARAAGHRVYATIAGWGIASDGKGGITRPEIGGYQLALSRAYARAEFGIESVAMFEGHGTGTAVGDATELRALSSARRRADESAPPAAISSIKALIGHTKAAAGVAGLIKAAMAVHHQVIPPTAGCVDPHPVLTADDAALRVVGKAEAWPEGAPVRAGVTAMGFGGINTHIVLEGNTPRRRRRMDSRTNLIASSRQDAEILLVDGTDPANLRERLVQLADFVPTLAYAQLADIAATLQREVRDLPYRAAAVVTAPEQAEKALRKLIDHLDQGVVRSVDLSGGTYLGHVRGPAQVGFLFPGQGSGRGTSGGALRRRFPEVDEVYDRAALPIGGDMVATAVAQPRIVTGSMAGMRALVSLGLDAQVAVGHSLGEISALHWAGVMDEEALLRVAATRGRTMTEFSRSGSMAGIGAGAHAVSRLLDGEPVVIAGFNGPRQTVVAGPESAIERILERAGAAGYECARLAVSHAFHSPLVAPAADEFARRIEAEDFAPIESRVISTVTGAVLDADTDVVGLLRTQITNPVLFEQAVKSAADEVDLFIEVGPGQVLSRMVREITDVPAVAVDTDSESIGSLLNVVGTAFVVGATLAHGALYQGRLTRDLQLGTQFKFFASPCEEAPEVDLPAFVAPPAGTRSEPAVATTPSAPAGEDSVGLLRRLAAQRAELPMDFVSPSSLLLDDLHLSSITVGQLVNQAARELGVPVAQTPTNFATATVAELAAALDELGGTATDADAMAAPAVVAGAASWARAFTIDLDDEPLPPRRAARVPGTWRVFADPGHPLAEPLRRALDRAEVGSGVLVCLPPEATVADIDTALAGARAALERTGDRFVLVQHGRGAAGLAKTLRLEAPQISTAIVHVAPEPAAVDLVVGEVAAGEGFVEVFYDTEYRRRVPVLRAMPVGEQQPADPVLDVQDVLLVTGGGKGITAECAFDLVRRTGARLAVLGRSDPATDTEVAANLARMAEACVDVHYVRADVTDPAQVAAAVAEIGEVFGPVTAVLHGAGRNEPAAITSLDGAAFRQTFAPKVDGLEAVLAAVDPARLRLLVTFGSIIGRAGLRGEGHYATANEWLADRTVRFGQQHPDCRVLCLEWSVWSGVGMGERLSVLESLTREGIVPISPDQGMTLLHRLLNDRATPPVVVVSGRVDDVDTVRLDRPELPLLRFVERPLVRYHGVEMVAEVELSATTDPYLNDHELDGNLLLPSVLGMEAMAQVATATTGWTGTPVFEDAEFRRPVVVPPAGSTTVRIAATVTGSDTVLVAIRSNETDYAVDHFTARLRFSGATAPDGPPAPATAELPPAPLDPATDLYGRTMFQGKMFHRLVRYQRASARAVDAVLAVPEHILWFSEYLPAGLLLGDPGVRDALMHGNQVCVPDATLLPEGVERIYPAGSRLVPGTDLTYSAVERRQDGDLYVYDIAVRDMTGTVVERWEGLRLRAVRKGDGRGPWVPALLGPFLEREAARRLGVTPALVVEPDPVDADRRTQTRLALSRAIAQPVEVRYRPDGRPEVDGYAVSAAHGAGLTLAVAGTTTSTVDVEVVADDDWADLLGADRDRLAATIAAQADEDLATSRTRVWCATECLAKAGVTAGAPISVSAVAASDPWVTLASGSLRIATFVSTIDGGDAPVVFAVLGEVR